MSSKQLPNRTYTQPLLIVLAVFACFLIGFSIKTSLSSGQNQTSITPAIPTPNPTLETPTASSAAKVSAYAATITIDATSSASPSASFRTVHVTSNNPHAESLNFSITIPEEWQIAPNQTLDPEIDLLRITNSTAAIMITKPVDSMPCVISDKSSENTITLKNVKYFTKDSIKWIRGIFAADAKNSVAIVCQKTDTGYTAKTAIGHIIFQNPTGDPKILAAFDKIVQSIKIEQ